MKNNRKVKHKRLKHGISKVALCVGLALGATHPMSNPLTAQEFVSVNLPDHLCAGTVDTVKFGYNPTYNIILEQLHSSLSRPGVTFLPDGVPCNGKCQYRSPVTFTDFAPGSQISSVQDIKYVRLNIEHSYIGDIFIGIECPNGNRASLMNWSYNGSSSCDDSIPSSYRNWSSGSNTLKSTYFGMAYDYTGYPTCDQSVPNNAPGIGWNYCWSNNTTSGYSYAPNDALIYRSASTHNGIVDSSNVAARTNFYHPNQNFSSLIGCPLNGEWAIVVVDAWSGDNGYIFDWELALDPDLLPIPCELVSRNIIGSGMAKINDSTFVLTVPSNLTTDSVMTFTVQMTNSCGETIDTVVSINVHPNLGGQRQDTVCDAYSWQGSMLTADTTLYTHLQTVHQCDSLLQIDVTVLHSSSDTINTVIIENDLPYTFLNTTFTAAVADTALHTTNAVGCDSTVVFTLHVWDNVTTTVDSTVCAHQLPVTWNGVAFSRADTGSVKLTTSHGADSVVYMTLYVLPDDTVYFYDTVVENSLPYVFAGHDHTGPVADTVTHLASSNGCDSALHLYLHVWYNQHTDLDTAVCARWMPVTWEGASFNDTHSIVLPDIHGADSVVTMHVTILPNDTTDIFDTVVENSLPHTFEGRWTFTTDADTNLGLVSVAGCDSVLHYRLHVWRNVEETFDTTVCDNVWPLEWHGYKFLFGGHAEVHTLTVHGADSTLLLNVAVNPVYDTSIDAEICDNETYTLGPQTLSAPGTYQHLFSTIHGCDSLVHVRLTVWPTYHTHFYDTVCASAGIDFEGTHYSQAGAYTVNYRTIHQCDSLATLHLTLKGLYLKARAHITPTIVTPGNTDIELEDISRAAIDRLWIIGDKEYTEAKFVYTYPEEFDTVELRLIAYSDDECTDTLNRLLQIDRTIILAPNAFTPSQETNDRWFIATRDISSLEVWIYNRQGFLMHHYTGTDGYWDGTHNGTPCRQDAYVFRAEYRSRVYPDRLQTATGTIMLIR